MQLKLVKVACLSLSSMRSLLKTFLSRLAIYNIEGKVADKMMQTEAKRAFGSW